MLGGPRTEAVFNTCAWEWVISISFSAKVQEKISSNCNKLKVFVCLFKGGVVVLHACLTIRNRICSVPRSLDPTPHPGGYIIKTRRDPVKDLKRIGLPRYLWTPCHENMASRKWGWHQTSFAMKVFFSNQLLTPQKEASGEYTNITSHRTLDRSNIRVAIHCHQYLLFY